MTSVSRRRNGLGCPCVARRSGRLVPICLVNQRGRVKSLARLLLREQQELLVPLRLFKGFRY
jgi:hypothetical protein